VDIHFSPLVKKIKSEKGRVKSEGQFIGYPPCFAFVTFHFSFLTFHCLSSVI